jgi:hypothetical protein
MTTLFQSVDGKVPSLMARNKKATSLITLILFVLIAVVLTGIIGATFFYTSGASAQTAGEQPFSTLTQVQDKLVGNFPDLVIDPSTFSATCKNGDSIQIKTAVENLGKKTAESSETNGFYVCEVGDECSLPASHCVGAKVPKLDSAGKAVVTISRTLSYSTGAGLVLENCPVEFTTTVNADCQDWVEEGNEDNNEIARICTRTASTTPNADCQAQTCTYACRAP